jgi:alpha-mannosidase
MRPEGSTMKRNQMTRRTRDSIGRDDRTVVAFVLLAFLAVLHTASRVSVAAENDSVVWSIGRADGSSIEFAPGQKDKATFTIGQSTPEKDFPAHQMGSISLNPYVPSGEKPYTVVFDLEQKARQDYELVVDVIFQIGAPREIRVEVNEHRGIFPFLPQPKQEIDSDEGNFVLLAKQRLVVPIEASWLKAKGNRISLIPLGEGEVTYDALNLRTGAGERASSQMGLRLEPTIFFRKAKDGLTEVCSLYVPFARRFAQGSATITVGGKRVTRRLSSRGYDFGVLTDRFEVVVPTKASKAAVKVSLDGRPQGVTQDFVPARQWKLYVCPKVHNDLGYSDLQPQVDEVDVRNTDTVLDLLAKYPFYKFNFDTAWAVENYLNNRPAEDQERLLHQLRKGRAGVNAFYFHLLTGLCSGEELYRSLYFAYRLHKDHGTNFDSASFSDAPTHTWFLPSLLTEVGIRGFALASNENRAPILCSTRLNETSPFYWEGLNGERIMSWYSRAYNQLSLLARVYSDFPVFSYEYMQAAVPQFLLRFMRADYPVDAVMIFGAYSDNAVMPEKGDEADLIAHWNQEYAFPKLIVATDAEYFAYIDKHFADRLPVYRGDAGAYWEDGAGSTSRATALNQRTKQTLPAAETIASFAALLNGRNQYPSEKLRAAWKDVLFYDEHTWGAHVSVRQPDREFVTRQWEIKKNYATRANFETRNLLTHSLYQLVQEVRLDPNSIVAVNLQPQVRTQPLEVEIDEDHYFVDPADNAPVKLDIIFEKDGWRKVRFMAKDVPPMGYKAYAVRHLESPRDPAPAKQVDSGASIENQYYRLEIDTRTGGLKSLYDKTGGKELVDGSAPYTLNQFLYVSGGGGTLLIDNIYGRRPPDLAIDSPASARIVERVRTPLGQRLIVEMRARNAPKIRSEYRLYEGLKRAEILNTLQKEEVRDQEAVYFAFPFAAQKPGFEYQIQNGWVRPNVDQLPGACREWFATQNLVHIRDGSFSIVWATPDAPLMTLTDIDRGRWLKHLEIKNGHVFSYVMNNYWWTNYKAVQGGDFSFRYYITSGEELTREGLSRFDVDTRTPVFAYPFLSPPTLQPQGQIRGPNQGSLLTLEAPNLEFVTFKKAEDGKGYILRLKEVAGRTGEAEVSFPLLRIDKAYLCNGVEAVLRELQSTQTSVSVPYDANRYITVRLEAAGAESSKSAGR